MSRSTCLLIIVSLLGLPVHSAGAQEQEAQPEAVSTPATGAERCVSLRHQQHQGAGRSDHPVQNDGNRTLVNRLPRRCPGLRFEKRFGYQTSLSQLCSTDIITVITDHGRGASWASEHSHSGYRRRKWQHQPGTASWCRWRRQRKNELR